MIVVDTIAIVSRDIQPPVGRNNASPCYVIKKSIPEVSSVGNKIFTYR